MACWVGTHDQVYLDKEAKTCSHCDITHREPQIFFFRWRSTRLADPFEPLNSSLAQSAEELGRW